MAGMCLVEGLREINAEKIALNSVYYWPDWRDGIARFLRDAGFDLVYAGNFVDQGLLPLPGGSERPGMDLPRRTRPRKSMEYGSPSRRPEADAIVVNGMPNFRRADGLPQRIAVSIETGLESQRRQANRLFGHRALLAHIQDPGHSADRGNTARLLSTLG